MPKPKIIQLTPNLVNELEGSRSRRVIGVVTDITNNEHLTFWRAGLVAPDRKGYFGVTGGAIGGYYARFCPPGEEIESGPKVSFRKKNGQIDLVVYSNDTCILSSSGYPYSNACIFSMQNASEGVSELIESIREAKPKGAFAQLSDKEMLRATEFIANDLRTGNGTRESRRIGLELDSLYGM